MFTNVEAAKFHFNFHSKLFYTFLLLCKPEEQHFVYSLL